MENVTYLHLPSGQQPPLLKEAASFKVVVVIEQAVEAEWQSLVSDWLVESRCLYMMAWGIDCSSWDDSVDHANLSAFDFGEIPDDSFVMTTWHADEPLREAFWYAAHTACHPTVALDRTMIVDISAKARMTELLAAYQAAADADV